MNKVVLLTGGNLGDRLSNIQNSEDMVRKNIGHIISMSPIIESEAWGFESKQAFLNQVIIVETEYSALEILDKTQRIEIKLGRVRKKEQWVSRIIDIDILFFNAEIIKTDLLTIPHKSIQARRFTLLALEYILKDYIHPVLGKSIQQLLLECKDELKSGIYHA